MDDDATKLLVEIRDILRQSVENDIVRWNQLQATSRRGRRVALIALLVCAGFLSVCVWGIISSAQLERERVQEERRHHEDLERGREELQRKMDERRNQFMRQM